ncbi:MATE family efflux transporter [Profundibacterium mesophilum]|uniref:Multidrug-efflux transporter n=1 Tax=Profundibacterium mesophilum KAUST100406-0324 TaxID=1037889 RepID=A0A921TDB1_9RHOB|nr:MATE family efflux transporter [Profundibacterium mesophilum]KAF0676603.1 putative multidrug resistance protein NorM [Profundibacterium mesophilum KAUST100406-0324]
MPEVTSRIGTAGHLRRILTLGLPLVGSHVAQFAITLTDALMLGWYGVADLAGQVLGGTLFFVLFIMGSGFAWAVMPMVARASGAGEDAQVRRVTRMALWLSLLFAALVMPVFLFARPLLDAMGQEPKVSALAGGYLALQGWAIAPALVVMVLKSYLAALERTQFVLWVTLAAVALNAAVNYALIFGNWGMPELGIIGAAWASLAVNIASMLAIIAYVIVSTPKHALFTRFWKPDGEAFVTVFRLGWPIGLTNLAEVGLFAASSVMMGWLGTVALAAHGIALQIASVSFMVHLGLSNAATVRAGNAMGRGNGPELRHGAWVVTVLSLVFAVATMLLFVLLPRPLLGLFIDPADPARGEVLAIGTGLLAAAALFQLVDAAQVMALGLLRGVQDTRVPMVIAGISYWLIGITISYVLGFTLGWGGVGIWLGLAAGLGAAAVLLMVRFWRPGGLAWTLDQPVKAPGAAKGSSG